MANMEPWRSVEDPDMVALFKQFSDFVGGSESAFTAKEDNNVKPFLYILRDHNQKGLYLHEEKLVTAPLQGSNVAHEEVLSVLPNMSLEISKSPLILGVEGGKRGLSCGKANEPKLQLEDFNLNDLSHNGEEAKRFTFFKDFNGSTHTFESAAYPEWFLCSSEDDHQPLSVTDQPGGTAITTFYFQKK